MLICLWQFSACVLFCRFSNDKPSWTYKPDGMHAVSAIDVGDRPIPEEPLYLILNLAISTAFTTIDYDGLRDLFPVHMDVDYIRVYQDPDNKVRRSAADPPSLPHTLAHCLAHSLTRVLSLPF
jgi:beta-glucanase (GH16 family)